MMMTRADDEHMRLSLSCCDFGRAINGANNDKQIRHVPAPQ